MQPVPADLSRLCLPCTPLLSILNEVPLRVKYYQQAVYQLHCMWYFLKGRLSGYAFLWRIATLLKQFTREMIRMMLCVILHLWAFKKIANMICQGGRTAVAAI